MNEPIQEGKPIYVFQLPIRIWHWSMVLSFLVLIPTGYIIGKPWHSLDGDPTYLFYMGYTRMAHFIAGFIIAIGLLWRIIFAFFGNKYSRQVFVMILTGFGMYVQSSDSVILQPFHLVVDFIYWIGDSGRDLHSYHRLGMLFLMCFIIIHLYMVIREEIMGKSTLVSTMFSGFRLLRSGKGG